MKTIRLYKLFGALCAFLLLAGGIGRAPPAAASEGSGFFESIPEGYPYIIVTAVQDDGGAQGNIPAPENYVLGTAAKTATISITFDDNDAWTDAAKNALNYAAGVWETMIVSPVPITIHANWQDLGNPLALGGAYSTEYPFNFQNAPLANTRYPVALANKLAGKDLYPGSYDIVAAFNSEFKVTVNNKLVSGWHLDPTTDPPLYLYDLASVAMHEIAHGLAFAGSLSVVSGYGKWNWYPTPYIYDTFTINGYGIKIFNPIFPNNSLLLGQQAVSNNLYFDGLRANQANYGRPPKLYAPSTWAQGSSFSHLDEDTFLRGTTNALLTPFLANGEAIHSPGPITLGMFEDMGWNISSSLVNMAPRAYMPLLSLNAPATRLGIYGSITLNKAPQVGTTVFLSRWQDNDPLPDKTRWEWTNIFTTTTIATGIYSFPNAPTLETGQKYTARYRNTSETAGRLYSWMTRELTGYTAGTQAEIGNFDIADVGLSLPADKATVTLPYTFTWTTRAGLTTDSYELNLYGPNYDPWWWTEPALGYTSTYSLTGLPENMLDTPAVFEVGKTYYWEIWVYSPDGGHGVSLQYRSVQFSNTGTPSTLLPEQDLSLKDRLPLRP